MYSVNRVAGEAIVSIRNQTDERVNLFYMYFFYFYFFCGERRGQPDQNCRR